jgi:hypothetical protein
MRVRMPVRLSGGEAHMHMQQHIVKVFSFIGLLENEKGSRA